MRPNNQIPSVVIALGSGVLMCIGAYLIFATLFRSDVSTVGLARPSGTPHIMTATLTTPSITAPRTLTSTSRPAQTTPFPLPPTSVPAATTVRPPGSATPIGPAPLVTGIPLPGEPACARTIVQPHPSSGTRNPVAWKTCRVSLEADDFYIIAQGKKFLGNVANVYVGGDPGHSTYCSLEISWKEHDVFMGFNMYFEADGQKWWASEIRTSNGGPSPGHVMYYGRFFESRLGAAATGNYHLTSSSSESYMTPNAAPGFSTLYFENMRLQAFLSPP